MESWFTYLKNGLSRKFPKDRISGLEDYSGIKAKLKNLRPFIHRHWKRGFIGVFLILISSLWALPQPLITRYLIDRVILERQLQLLAVALILLAGIAFIEMAISFFQQFYLARFERNVMLDIQETMFNHVLRLPKAFFDSKDTGYLMSRLSSDVQGLRWFFSSTIVYILGNLIRFIGGMGLLFYLEWRLAIAVLFVLPGLALCVRYFSRKIHALSHQGMEQYAKVSSNLQESLSSVSLIKVFASEYRTLGRLMEELKTSFQISLEQSTVSAFANLLIHSLPGISHLIVLIFGVYWVIQGEWTLGSLLAFQAYMGYVFGPAQFLSQANLQLQNARAALERVSALFDIVPEENMGQGRIVSHLKGEIEFKDVSFAYDNREPVLKNISFHIQPGEHIAIVGPSGVGKTTLLSLILRFYKPTSGEIYFDGFPASDYEVGSLRSRIGYVPQSPLLLSGSIKENLRYGDSEADEEQIIRAAGAAEIHEFIHSLPKGYETEIGEKGVSLSEGQKQRISIARALIKNPDILILDEPTSSLDSVTEASIFQSIPIFIKNKTLFIVAHTLGTIKDSDRILLLNENDLITIGTHQSLKETNDYYRSLIIH